MQRILKLVRSGQEDAIVSQVVYTWLSNDRNGRWVIILDSADDRDVFYAANTAWSNACPARKKELERIE